MPTTAQKNFMDTSALYLTSSADISPTTQENRSRRLGDYLNSMLEHGTDPGVVAVLGWKQDMLARGMKPSSIRQYLVELHAFYEWSIEHDLYDGENPVKKSDIRKETQNPYQLMSERDMMKLLDMEKPKNAKDTYWERNRTIVVLLMTTALRNSELRALVPGDLDWENEEIFVRNGKGGKDRYVNFPHLARLAVRQYLDSGFRPQEAGDDAPLFGRVEQGRWKGITSRSALTVMVQRYVKMVVPDYDKLVGSHALRHVGASLLLTNGDTMENIQATLGHANISTTKIYAERLRPSKKHVKSANGIWDEIEYQTRKADAAQTHC